MLVWYTIVTALFRCPSSLSDLTDDSPQVCKTYLNVRSHLAPYFEPYYHSYAAPYVNKARPYVEKFNEQIYDPTLNYGKQSYEAYGAPRFNQVREFSQEKWDTILKPQIDTAQAQAKQQYDSNVAPQVSRASAVASPYFTSSRESVSHIYSTRLLPAYEAFRPYVEKTYAFGHKLAVDTGLPYAQTAWASSVVFFDRTFWPKLRILYGENVEPQLVRIGERLGRYRDGKKLKAAMEDSESSTQVSSMASSLSSVAAPVLPTQSPGSTATAESQAASASTSLTLEQEAEQTREKIESDLKNWQDKFAKAADKGTEDLEERLKEITDRQIENRVRGVGEALIIQLEESASSEVTKLKSEIQTLVKRSSEGYGDIDIGKASLHLSQVTRNAGLAVKEKGEAFRSWKKNYDQETRSLVSKASNSTLEVIDNIRDLGLQEIGLRWAQMEGVTYKDWSKYHEVKKTFDEWREKVEAVARDHEGLKKSEEASGELDLKGMACAEHAAKELARLKEVGQWKIEAGDASDDFSTKYLPAKAAAVGQEAAKKASFASKKIEEKIIGAPQSTVKSTVSGATQKASDAASKISSVIVGTEPGATEHASSQVFEAASDASEKVSEAVAGTTKPRAESVVSAAKDKADKVASDASQAIIGTPTPAYESVASKPTESAASAASAASEAVSGSSASLTEGASDIAGSISSSASSMASQASKKVPGGAMAQEVGEQKPIFDDIISDDEDATYSEKLHSMVGQAGDKYAEVTKAVSEALAKATSTQGTVESASSVADEQYSKALSAASSALYGTQQGTAESATSVAAGKYAQAVSA